jgi:hypothetical protein
VKRSQLSVKNLKIVTLDFPSLDLSGLDALDFRGIRLSPDDIIRIFEETPDTLRSLNLVYFTQVQEFNLSNEEILSWGERVRELGLSRTGLGFLKDEECLLADWLICKCQELVAEILAGNGN